MWSTWLLLAGDRVVFLPGVAVELVVCLQALRVL
jgi:hypothetical protein